MDTMKPNFSYSRLFGFTDDLKQENLVDMLAHFLNNGRLTYADIKGWRRKNNFPVDRED